MSALAIIGLLPDGLSATGSVRLDNEEILGRSDKVLQEIRGNKIAMVFQEPLTALDPLMRVGKQIAEPLKAHGLRGKQKINDKVTELLKLVAITDAQRVLRSYPWQLSGGQRQRIAIAMALANEPEVLIADEPTTALDVTVQAEILTLLEDIVRKTGLTLIFVSHDLPVVSLVCDEIIVMQGGKIVETGLTQDIINSPKEPYTQSLIAAAREVSALPKGDA